MRIPCQRELNHINIIFLWVSCRYLRKALTKEKKTNVNDFFIAVLVHFYNLNYLNSIKSRLSNKKIGHGARSNFDSKFKNGIVTKFKVSIFKNDEVRGGGGVSSPPNVK